MIDEAKLKNALKDMLSYVPVSAKPSDYAEVLGLNKDWVKEDDGNPFMSESFLYNVIGKHDARSVLFKFSQICDAAGFDMFELEKEINNNSNS